MTPRELRAVLFVAAAGPRRGFGHLIRCGVLADALSARRDLVLRGSDEALHAALALGWTVHRGPARRLLAAAAPDLVIVDDPSPRHVAGWIRAARGLGITIATLHDLGLARTREASDIVIDGSLARPRRLPAAHLDGPKFAVIDPALASLRPTGRRRPIGPVVLGLGGGSSARAAGIRLAVEITRVAARAHVQIATGFSAARAQDRVLPPRCEWIAPRDLKTALSRAAVAVVAGGVTLYEACALGVPIVGMPIVPAQIRTVRACADAGAALDGTGATRSQSIRRTARAVAQLLADRHSASRLSRAARRLIDGRGTARVVRRLEASIAAQYAERASHAA